MLLKEQEELFDKFTAAIKEIQLAKGSDYAQEDRLSNFKYVGSICGTNASIACLHLIATKVARLGVLLNSKDVPKNEPIKDSILDLTSYSILLHMIEKEKE